MKYLLIASVLFTSLSAFAAPLKLECMAGSINTKGDDVEASEIYLQESFELEESQSAVFIFDGNKTRLVLDGDLQDSDDGKKIVVLGQNIDPEGLDPVGLNIIKATLDYSQGSNNVLGITDFTQLASIENVDFITLDYQGQTFVKCRSL